MRIVIGSALIGSASAAKFTVNKSDREMLVVSLNGQIELSDQKKTQKIIESNQFARHKFLSLNSIGGLVHSAIELGLTIRHFGIRTIIPRNAICISACSMVFVAGWDRKRMIPARFKHAQSRLGVHRPYQKNLQTAAPDIMQAVQIYLDIMNAGKKITQLTMSTSSRKLRLIKNAELKAMGNYRIMSLTKTQEVRKSNKNASRKTRPRLSENLEQWRRSIHENSD